MESSQASWREDLPYDDLIKKCPYLAQKSGLQLTSKQPEGFGGLEPSISKSKKKRLKKRLKALSVAKKITGSDEILPEEKHSECSASSVTNESQEPLGVLGISELTKPDPVKKNKCKSDKLKLPVHNIQARSEIDIIKETKVIVDKGEMSSKSKNTPSPGSHKNANSIKSPQKEKVPDVVDGEVLISNVNVNRAQVLAEREAKKKIKQLSKQKKQVVANESVTVKSFDISDVKPLSENEIKHSPIVGKVCQTEVKSFNIEIDNKVPPVAVHGEAIPTSKQSAPDKNTSSEKTREEVLAEREAKKKAKQLAKQKKIEPAQTPIPNDNNVVDSNIIDTIVNAQSNDKHSDIHSTETLGKSKAELRAERRAKQEAQRAAKEAEKKSKSDGKDANKENIQKPDKTVSPQKEIAKEIKVVSKPKTSVITQQRIKLFSHLHIGPKPAQAQILPNIHPSIIELGVKYSSRIINGSNSRCVALLNCLKDVIQDYVTPAEKEFSRGLESKLGELTNYLNQCRPMAVSMTNALRHIKSHLTQLPNNVSDDEAKRKLLDVIDTFIREQIDVAGEAICETVKKKIANGDVILIYSCSSLLYRILVESHRTGREFSVVVVDGGPWFEGREMLRRLVSAGINCTYVQVSAVSFIMKQATKVLLGAHALLANGCVMSRAGASLIALAARSCNVPVLVCCETYKFSERVQTDAFVYNELGSPDEIMSEDLPYLSPLSLLYDITPPDLVTAVVTELAILPCTSVPVILRVKPSDHIS